MEKILVIEPGNYDALAALATALAPSDPAAAASYARRALAIRPNNTLSALLSALEKAGI